MIRFIILLALPFLLVSCIYENNDVYVSPVKPPTGAGSSINLNAVSGDIVLHKPTGFEFHVSPSGKDKYAAKVKVNGSLLYTLSNDFGGNTFYFVLDPSVIGNGEKKLSIEVTYTSNSPSLAGQMGAEFITFSQEWTIFVDITKPSSIPAPNVYMEDGKSMLSWTAPDRYSFNELIVLRTYYDSDGSVEHRDSIKIQDHTTTLFHDASYVGGPVTYSVDLKGYKFYSKGGETSFNVKPISFSIDSLASTPIISWKRSPLFNNDIRFSVYGTPHPVNEPGSIENYTRFGQPSSLPFKVQANNPPPSQVYSAYEYEVYAVSFLGVKIRPFSFIHYLPDKDLYLLTSSKVYKIDPVTLEEIGSFDPGFSGYPILSPNGLYAYFLTETELYAFDVNTMTMTGKVDLTTIIGNNYHGFYGTPVLSDNNILTCSLNYWNGPKDYAIDLNTNQVVWQQDGNSFPAISPDGKYIYANGMIYQNNNSNWTLLAKLPDPYKIATARFRQGNYNQIIVYLNTYPDEATQLYDLNSTPDSNGFLVPIVALPHAYRVIFDESTQSFAWIHRFESWIGEAFVYDIENNFTQTRHLDVIYNPDDAFFVNGHFFHRNGYYLP